MNDLVYILEYIKVPHPLKRGEFIIAGDDYKFQKILYKLYPFFKSPEYNLPRIERKVFVPFRESITPEEIEKEVVLYEKKVIKDFKKEKYLRILKSWIRIGLSLASSYLIWTILWRLPWLYSAIDKCFRAVGDFLSPYAIAVMILSPTIASFYYALTGKNSLPKLYKALKPFKVYESFGKESSSRFLFDIRKLRENLKTKVGKKHPVIEKINSLEDILSRKEWDKIKDTLQSLLDLVSFDPHFPWSERKNIIAMTKDILYHLENKFIFAPLKIISPSNNKSGSLKDEQKLFSLENFFSSAEFNTTREKIVTNYLSLSHASIKSQRIKFTQDISSFFQKMVFLSSRLHLGQTPLPYERGTILKDLYHNLFVTFGKVCYFLRKRKCGNFSSSRIIKKMQKNLKSTFELGEKNTPHILLQIAAKPAVGFLISLGVLALFAAPTGFHLIFPDEVAIIHNYRFSYQGFLGEEVKVKDYFSFPTTLGLQNLKLFWEVPKPFCFVHNINLKKTYSGKVFIILQEVEPSGILDRFFHLFREEWGKGYTGLNLQFTYKIHNPELWAMYDYDGKGKERLSRDLEPYTLQYIEKKKQDYKENLYRENPAEIDSHFKKCLAQGKVKEWIRRFLYPSLLDTYRVGSMYERYLAGLRWLKEHPRMRDNPQWQKFVEHEIKNIEKLNRVENEKLIFRPLKVKKIMKNPKIADIQAYENLYRTIHYLVVEDLVNEKITEEIKNSDEKKEESYLTEGIVDWIRQNSQIENLTGIRIISVKPSLKKVSALEWQNELRKRQNLM